MAMKAYGVESHNALGAREPHHTYHLQVFRRVVDSNDKIGNHSSLTLAVKTANDTAEAHGHFPTI